MRIFTSFFFNDTATTEIYTLSLHDALPILATANERLGERVEPQRMVEILYRFARVDAIALVGGHHEAAERSEEHTSELQSPCNLVCRLLLEKKKEKE